MSKLNANPAEIKSRCSSIDAAIANLNACQAEYQAIAKSISSSQAQGVNAMKELANKQEKMVTSSIKMLKNVSKVLLSMGDSIEMSDTKLANKNKL